MVFSDMVKGMLSRNSGDDGHMPQARTRQQALSMSKHAHTLFPGSCIANRNSKVTFRHKYPVWLVYLAGARSPHNMRRGHAPISVTLYTFGSMWQIPEKFSKLVSPIWLAKTSWLSQCEVAYRPALVLSQANKGVCVYPFRCFPGTLAHIICSYSPVHYYK